MAANYWASTQRRHWQFSRETLADIRQKLEDDDRALVQQYPLPDRRLLSQFFSQRTYSHSLNAADFLIEVHSIELAKLGKRLIVRQQPLATAQVYLRRFYSKVEIRRTNPLPCPGYCAIFGLQDGRMPSAYQSCRERSSSTVARFVLFLIHQVILAEEDLSRLHHLRRFETRRMRILFDI